jgi:uncharacterized protein (DUF4415 family)
MIGKDTRTKASWLDPADDAPELTPELARRAQISFDGAVIRESFGTVRKRGRPPVGGEPKQQVTFRVAPELLHAMRATGAGWQVRAEAVLRREFVDRVASEGGKAQSLARKVSKRILGSTTRTKNDRQKKSA